MRRLIMFWVCRWSQDGGPQYAHQHGRRQGTTISISCHITKPKGPATIPDSSSRPLSERDQCIPSDDTQGHGPAPLPLLLPIAEQPLCILFVYFLCFCLFDWIIGGGCAGPAVCGDADRVEVLRQPDGLDPHGQQRRLQPHPLWGGELRHR